MAIKVTLICDGCSATISDVDANDTNQLFESYAKSNNVDARLSRQANPEIYCGKCRDRSVEYWQAKNQLAANIAREFAGRLENHKRRFWTVQKNNVVKIGG